MHTTTPPYISVNGVRLRVQEKGDGEPLVLVHGSWGDRHRWSLIDDDLARAFHVVSYDRRGHTDSEPGPAPRTRRADEDDLAALIEALGIGPVHLVGSSMGGSIVLDLAGRRPDLVRTVSAHEPGAADLVAEHPTVTETHASMKAIAAMIDAGEHEAAARTFVEEVAVGPGGWDASPESVHQMMVRNASAFAGEMSDPDWGKLDIAAIAAVDRPIVITRGDQSLPWFGPIVDRLAESLPNATVQTIPGAGHIPHVTHTAEYVALITAHATLR